MPAVTNWQRSGGHPEAFTQSTCTKTQLLGASAIQGLLTFFECVQWWRERHKTTEEKDKSQNRDVLQQAVFQPLPVSEWGFALGELIHGRPVWISMSMQLYSEVDILCLSRTSVCQGLWQGIRIRERADTFKKYRVLIPFLISYSHIQYSDFTFMYRLARISHQTLSQFVVGCHEHYKTEQ